MATDNNIKTCVDALISLADELIKDTPPKLCIDLAITLCIVKYFHAESQKDVVKEQRKTFSDYIKHLTCPPLLKLGNHEPSISEQLNIALLSDLRDYGDLRSSIENVFSGSYVCDYQTNISLKRSIKILEKCKGSFHQGTSEILLGVLNHFSKQKKTRTNSPQVIPQEVAQLIVNLLEPKPKSSIYDPMCGSASLLVHCKGQLKARHNIDADTRLYGEEKDTYNIGIANILNFLESESHSQLANTDCLSAPAFTNSPESLKKFDMVVCTPSFESTGWDSQIAENDLFSRFIRGTPAQSRPEYALISHILSTLKPNGQAAVILQSGVLFREGIEGNIRKQIIDEKRLQAVIKLPTRILAHHHTQSILLIFIGGVSEHGIMFIDSGLDSERSHQKRIDPYIIDRITRCYHKKTHHQGFCRLVGYDEIQSNNYNLNIPLYINNQSLGDEENSCAVFDERFELEKQISMLENRIKKKHQFLIKDNIHIPFNK